MKIEKVDINELKSPAYNPREITPAEMEKLINSIKEFGYVDPIIVNDFNMHIVGGNQRYEALKMMGWTEVDVVYIHEENLNREKALNIALNKINGEWDFDKLTDIFNELQEIGFDLSFTGFDEFEIDALVTDDDEISSLFDYDDEEEDDDEELEDYLEVEGEHVRSYVVSVSFTTKEKVNNFLKYIGSDKEIVRDTILVKEEDLDRSFE